MISELETRTRGKRRRMIQTTNLLLLLMICIFVSFRYQQIGATNPPYPAMLIAILTLANSIYIHRNGSVKIASWFIFSILIFGLIISGMNTGAISGATVLLSPILPVLAVLLINAFAGWMALGLISLILTAFCLLELYGLILPNPHDADGIIISRFFALVSTTAICTWIVWIFYKYQRELVEMISNQAKTDHLTGVPNRRALGPVMLREIGRARRTDTWFSLIMTDVDHFKRYNDENGHQAGDGCLIKVAHTLIESAQRPGDFVARFGGEEFIILLPETEYSGACQVANEIRRNVLKQQIRYDSENLECVSLTLGVVSIRGRHIKSIEQLIKEADNALYYGKSQGRNCVIGICLNELQEEDFIPEYVKCA